MNLKFKEEVYAVMRSVPIGKVVSYSQVALTCGKPGAARQVGQIAHFGPSNLPWHRLVKANGALANGFVPGGPEYQAQLLKNEGVTISSGRVIMKEFQL